jgi:hypothetical protein
MYYRSRDGDKDIEYSSVLAAIEERDIFTLIPEGSDLNLTEACDHWFTVMLTPDDVRKLAAELLELVDESK